MHCESSDLLPPSRVSESSHILLVINTDFLSISSLWLNSLNLSPLVLLVVTPVSVSTWWLCSRWCCRSFRGCSQRQRSWVFLIKRGALLSQFLVKFPLVEIHRFPHGWRMYMKTLSPDTSPNNSHLEFQDRCWENNQSIPSAFMH